MPKNFERADMEDGESECTRGSCCSANDQCLLIALSCVGLEYMGYEMSLPFLE